MDIVVINKVNCNLVTQFMQHKLSRHFRYFSHRTVDSVKNHLVTVIGLIDSNPIGYGHIDIENDTYWLGVCILEEYQGRGYGTKIIEYLLDIFKPISSINVLYLTVDKDNIGAFVLYKKFGFKVLEETAKYYKMSLDINL